MRNWLRRQWAEFKAEYKEHPWLMSYALLSALGATALLITILVTVY